MIDILQATIRLYEKGKEKSLFYGTKYNEIVRVKNEREFGIAG